MSIDLLARKGEANPATTHHGGESRFQARRIVVLPPIAFHRPSVSAETSDNTGARVLRQAANMARPFRPPAKRRKFTFRIEPDRHNAFCAAAESLGISRQQLLTQALDAYLQERALSEAGPEQVTATPEPQLPFDGISANQAGHV